MKSAGRTREVFADSPAEQHIARGSKAALPNDEHCAAEAEAYANPACWSPTGEFSPPTAEYRPRSALRESMALLHPLWN
ncbi:MAG: hypothetical protein ACRD3Y_10480, partial [Bryobacteraceae bacterium]